MTLIPSSPRAEDAYLLSSCSDTTLLAQMSNEKLTLFTAPSVFVNPSRVRLFAYEKGIADKLDEKFLDMTAKGEQRGWRHLKAKPFGETPALQLADGTVISESTAIAR